MIDAIIFLLGGLGAFLLGFQVLSDNIEKLAAKKLRQLFNKTSKSKLVGMGVGLATTAIIQCSSATTVMVVGFVNANIMSLFTATTMIMGANIGTTVTAQIVALKAFSFTKFAIIFTCIGIFINMFAKTDKKKTFGLLLAGLGLIFLGLETMSSSMKAFRESQVFVDALSVITNPLLLLLIGAAFTAIVQSSSAVTSILITMVGAGFVIGGGGNAILYVILGTNIGTCVTALLSSIGASTNAKRASLIHLMFNVFGSMIFFIVLVIWRGFMDNVFSKIFSEPGTQIAMFHTFFNTICVAIFLPFTNVFVKLSKIIIRDKKIPEDIKITYMDSRILNTPTIAISQLTKEVVRMGDTSIKALEKALEMFYQKSIDDEQNVREIINEANIMNKQITDYLVKVSTNNLSYNDEVAIAKLYHVIADLLRINEVADNVVKYTTSVVEQGLEFSESVMESISEMYTQVKELYQESIAVFMTQNLNRLPKVDSMEEKVDRMRKELIDAHIKRLNDGKCKASSSGVFINLVSNLERVADHITYVAYSIKEEKKR